MLVSQRSAYMLQQKLDAINSAEAAEVKSMSHSDVMDHSSELYDYFAQARQDIWVKYNKQRNKAIWWYQHQNDFIASAIVLAAAGLCVYFVLA